MAAMTLYFAPGSCSRASLIALEETGAPYESKVVAFMKGEQRAPDYLKRNPRGKVPLLMVGDEPITETVAIFQYLDEQYPAAHLLPHPASAIERARVLGDLCWGPSTLHPLVARIRFPQMMSSDAQGLDGIYTAATAATKTAFELIERRLSDREWWHGQWSAQDAYIYWAWTRISESGFDMSPFPRYADHAARMARRPAVQRALAREAEGQEILTKAGAALNVPAYRVGQKA
jgi:glutathione S-transferase